jgi:TolB-like protein
MNKSAFSSGLAVLTCVLSGCAQTNLRAARAPVAPVPRVNLAANTSTAVDRLLGSMSPPLAVDTTVLVASFVDLNGLSASSKLGRLLAEQTAAHLIQRGYRVPEVRLTSELHVRPGGEFMLSRDTKEIQKDLYAGVVVTGTITSIAGITYVNLRVVDVLTHIARGAADLELPDQFNR